MRLRKYFFASVFAFGAALTLFASAPRAHAAIAYVTSTKVATGSGTTCALPVIKNVSAGDLLVVAAQFRNNSTGTASVADTKSNNWLTAKRATSTAGTVYIFYAPNVASGNTTTTVTFSVSMNNGSCEEMEYSGLASTSTLDIANASSGTGTSLTSGTSTTAYQNELLVGGSLASSTAATYTAGASYALRATSTIGAAEDRIVAASSSYSAPATLGSSVAWVDAVASFIGAIGTPGTPTYTGQTSSSPSTLTINWTSAANASYYKVESSTDGNAFAQLATTTALTYAASGLSANTTYWYRARATNNIGDSSYSASSSVLTYPDQPTLNAFTNVQSSTLTVNWTNPTGGASSTKIERATSTQVYAQIASGVSGASYNDSGLATSTTYYYRVRSTNATPVDGLYSASSSQATTNGTAPNAPTQNAPSNAVQDQLTSPVFRMTATDPESDTIRYKVLIYSGGSCSGGALQTDDENSSQTGWSGQNASSSSSYTSGSQGTYTVLSALSSNTTYSWTASAIDPAGSNTWSATSSCQSFTTTYGNWTTDSGSWSISGNQLTATPATGTSVQLHATGRTATNDIIEFKLQSSAVGANTGNAGGIMRADTGANRYQLTYGDFLNQNEVIGKRIANAFTSLSTGAFTFSAATYYEFRGSLSGTTLKSWVNGATALSTTDSALSSANNYGLAASSTNGSATFTFDNFALYSSTVVTLSNLPSGGSWAVQNSGGAKVMGTCATASTIDLATATTSVPIDYDAGGGNISVWAGNTACSGTADATYPASGLAADIFGGDTYSYSTSSVNTPSQITITISASGLISY